MPLNLSELDPGSPDFDDAVEAAQAEEDAARGAIEEPAPEQEPAAEAAAESQDAPAADAAADQATSAEPEKPAPVGVLSKDGKTVLSYGVVQAARAERRAEREARLAAEAERDALRQQIEDLKAGRQPTVEVDPFSDEAIADVAGDFPIVGELAKALKETRAELAQLKPPAEAKPADKAPSVEDMVQEAIDSVPLLADWQATDTEKFERAKEIDRALQNSPKWRGRPLHERFDHVSRMVADEYDIQVQGPEPSPTPTPNRANPKEVISAARRATPSTLSDFKSGAAPATDAIDKLPPLQMQARLAKWSDAEIDAWLSKFG